MSDVLFCVVAEQDVVLAHFIQVKEQEISPSSGPQRQSGGFYKHLHALQTWTALSLWKIFMKTYCKEIKA